jgi:hypothetical protein
MTNNMNDVLRLLWTLVHEWFYATFVHLYVIHTLLVLSYSNGMVNEECKSNCSVNIHFYSTFNRFISGESMSLTLELTQCSQEANEREREKDSSDDVVSVKCNGLR